MLIIYMREQVQSLRIPLSYYVPSLHPQQYPTNVQTKNITSTRGTRDLKSLTWM